MSERKKNLRRSTILQSSDNKTKPKIATDDDDINLTEVEKELEKLEETVSKPTELYNSDDVAGQKLYSFARKSKNLMKERLKEMPKMIREAKAKPSMLINKKETQHLKIVLEKLPDGKSYRTKPKESSSESESVTESEYEPSSDDENNIDDDDEDEDAGEDEDEDVEDNNEMDEESFSENEHFIDKEDKITKTPMSKKKLKTCKSNVYSEYFVNPNQYFDQQTMKIKTSNRKLSRLKRATLKPEHMKKLLKSQSHISKEHADALIKLSEELHDAFPMWKFILEEGFNIMLYGLGSKRNIILDFQKEMVSEHPSVIINGYFPSLTLKEIMDSIIVELLEMDPISDIHECLRVINTTMLENPDGHLYLFIHNLDGPTLMSDKVQDFLSRLASIPNVHMLASVDHTNAPILWDNVKRSRFNFFWCDATTFQPYQEETSYESSLFVQHSGILALSSLQNVFQSLNSNAKKIFIMLTKYQIENHSSLYKGMLFNQLYQNARDEFVVTSDASLRAQLVEFIDHNLIKQKRNADGTEYLIIPLSKEILEQFLDEHLDEMT